MKKILLTLSLALVLALTAAVCSAESSLTIDGAVLTGEPAFIDWVQDGVAMQLIALKGGDGEVRLAFNTCQSCNGSPYAYFEYLGQDTLQCQNCGLTFSTDTVGTAQAAGCNPFTISEFTVDGDSVVVPEGVLAAGAKLFKNWKAFD